MAPDSRRRGGWDSVAQIVEQRSRDTDAVFFAPPDSRASFAVQYTGRPLELYGVDTFAQYYYERGNSFSQPIDAAALQARIDCGGRAWIIWDRTYVRNLPRPTNAQIEEHSFGSTTLLLATPRVAARPAATSSGCAATSMPREACQCAK
jgi:hypothetical protein